MLTALLSAGCAGTVRTGPGSLAPYQIRGKAYTPVKNWSGYEEEGIASWYGPNYHGRMTSNGETFDTYTFTAAHTVLPMNVCLDVTNLENGKDVTVRINDRGPFASGRIIDLSYAAADQIGMIKKGTARVKVKAVGTANDSGDCPGGPSELTKFKAWFLRIF